MKLTDSATFAGAAVVATVALSAVAMTLTTAVLYFRGDGEGAKDAGQFTLGIIGILTALLARTRPDPGMTPTTEETYVMEDPESGAVDATTLLVIVVVVILVLLLLGRL